MSKCREKDSTHMIQYMRTVNSNTSGKQVGVCGQIVATLLIVCSGKASVNMTFVKRFEGNEGKNHDRVWGKWPRKRKCENVEGRESFLCLRRPVHPELSDREGAGDRTEQGKDWGEEGPTKPVGWSKNWAFLLKRWGTNQALWIEVGREAPYVFTGFPWPLSCEYTVVLGAEKPIRRLRQSDGGEHHGESYGRKILDMFWS